jgi:hypothetical protein
LRGAVLMRLMFAVYLVVIGAGLVCAFLVGLLGV